jgi:hypothetical protein
MALFGKNSIANLEAQAEKAKQELDAAEAAFASAVQAMEAPPIELTDDQVGDLVGVKNLAEVRLVKARAGRRRADIALIEAKNAAVEKERSTGISRVTSMGTAAQKLARAELEAATKGLRNALRALAEAESERLKLNARLPAEQQISSFEEDR